MRTLIVDPEPRGRAVLSQLCEDDASIDEVRVAESGAAAIEIINANRPDLLFLDVELKDMTGFDVLRSIKGSRRPAVIMVAAHGAHAAEAFRGGAIDYLTKPVAAKQIANAIEKAQQQHDLSLRRKQGNLSVRSSQSSRRPHARLMAEQSRRLYFLAVADIDYIEACGNYVLVHVGDQQYVRRDTLKRLSAALRDDEFVWIRRTTLINLSRVAFAEKCGRGALAFTLTSGTRLLSRMGIKLEQMPPDSGEVEP